MLVSKVLPSEIGGIPFRTAFKTVIVGGHREYDTTAVTAHDLRADAFEEDVLKSTIKEFKD
jgi:hypothetical protein